MFGKLMKAEWRASRRVVGILCLAVLIAALVLGLVGCGLFMAETRSWNVHGTVEMIVALLCVAAVMVIAVAWAASIFYALWRFYRSRFTEEGYLTFTLPVNGHQLMLSSILASILEILAVLLATAVACVLDWGSALWAFPGTRPRRTSGPGSGSSWGSCGRNLCPTAARWQRRRWRRS